MKKITFLLTNIVLLLTLTSCATSKGNNKVSLNIALNEGTSAFDEKDYVKAEELFSNALLIENNNEIVLKNEILTLNKLERNTEALTLVKKALLFYPDSIKFKLIEARLLRILEKDLDAINSYKEILKQVDAQESYHKEYIEYLISLLPSDNTIITSSALEESNFLLKSNMCTEQALIALCTIDKTSLLYSLMLNEKNPTEWTKVYELEDSANTEMSNIDDISPDLLTVQENINIDTFEEDNNKSLPPKNDNSNNLQPLPQEGIIN